MGDTAAEHPRFDDRQSQAVGKNAGPDRPTRSNLVVGQPLTPGERLVGECTYSSPTLEHTIDVDPLYAQRSAFGGGFARVTPPLCIDVVADDSDGVLSGVGVTGGAERSELVQAVVIARVSKHTTCLFLTRASCALSA
jgi:hypothetical protein